jgi:hypothetical protein
MKPTKPHIIVAPLRKLAKDLEQTFFRIEQANSWQAAIVNGAIAGAAVALVAWLMTTLEEGDLLLFACLGSSAASVVFAPLAKTNSLRSIVAAYMITSVVCVMLSPVHENAITRGVFSGGGNSNQRDATDRRDAPRRHR